MCRVMIVGQSGSGKSTMARMIGARTGLPVVHIDQIHWKPGWVERTRDEKIALCQEVHARDAWVFEGSVAATWGERLRRADTLIWLDFPVGLRLWRVFRRSLRYWGRTRPDLPEGCPERLEPSFYKWIWVTRRSGRAKLQDLVNRTPTEKDVVIIRSVREAQDYVASLKPQGLSSAGAGDAAEPASKPPST